MVEVTRQRKSATSLQAGPGEIDPNNLYAINMRVTQLAGRQLAQIGDELENKWRQQLPVQWHHLNMGIYSYIRTRRAFSEILGSLWGSKMMSMLRKSWLVPKIQTGCQEARKWAAWVSNLSVSYWSRRTTYILASAFSLVAVSIFLTTWNDSQG
ncbi:bcl-2-interacting killer [Xyrauchen texanus]|uniref:bcl-2-interacting killer n=1 Tax=Xyrauchen texanus TaxID=154827 RepID=UPI0022420458|nr:bcl-2-interacting killer [Xyrauchen texanus]